MVQESAADGCDEAYVDECRAQQWHDREQAADAAHGNYSSCWCCCTDCDPDYGGPGSPHWAAAMASLRSKA